MESPIVESPELIEAAKMLEACLNEGDKAAWKAGVYYNRIVDQKLAEKCGYRHARDFVSARFKDISQATLTPQRAVGRAFSEMVSSKYGAWRLAGAPTYATPARVAFAHDETG